MSKKKKRTLRRGLKRVVSLAVVLSLCTGLVVSAGVFYPEETDTASAATFSTTGSGVTAPSYNSANFTTLNTEGGYSYYYGKYGNAFYGVEDNSSDGTWELVDTDAAMNGTSLTSAWEDCITTANDAATTYFSAADRVAMVTQDVSPNGYYKYNGNDISAVFSVIVSYSYDSDGNITGTTKSSSLRNSIPGDSVSGAYMWPLSYYTIDSDGTFNLPYYSTTMASKIKANAGSSPWTRTITTIIKPPNSNDYNYSAFTMDGDVSSNSNPVAPAFNLNLEKVLLTKSATSAKTSTSLSASSVATGNLKFLTNVGSTKASSFNVSSISGKTLTNVFAGKSYTFSYTGASTSTLNSGTNYISAILYDSNGKVAYYGNLGTVSSASGSASITIPSGLSGTYTLAIFEEEKCAAYATDYACTPVYAKFTVQTTDYETSATISSTASSSVNVGDVISNSSFSASVTYLSGTTETKSVYLVASSDFSSMTDAQKRAITSTSVTVPNGSSTFKVTAVFVPTYTTTKSYWSQEYTFNLDYESSTSFTTTHGSSFSVNDTITSDEFSGTITWLAGGKTTVAADDLYIVPTSVWGSGLTKTQVKALSEYSGGKSIKITTDMLAGASSYSITAVYFPSVAGADSFHAQAFEFASASLYAVDFTAVYNGTSIEYGELLTDEEFTGTYTTSDGDSTKVTASTIYILPTDTWDSLSDTVKGNEAKLKQVSGVNSTVVPSESDLGDADAYDITAVYYDYSEQHSYGGGTDAGDCNYYAVTVSVPLAGTAEKNYKSYTESGITWYYQVDDDGNAANVYTLNEDINQAVGTDGALNIPESVGGYTVKSIGGGTKDTPFVPANVNSFTSISFPDTVTQINDYAFYSNTSFLRLSVPKTVSSIGNFAFYDCDNMSSVKIVSANIGTAAFGGCSGITSCTVSGDSTIGKVAFAECSSLTKLTISGATDVEKSAFANDTGINALNLSGLSGAEISAYAFMGCTSIKEVSIPEGNTVLAYAFDGCTGITNLELDVDTVYNYSFSGCYQIQYVIFGENVSTVEYAWGGCSGDLYAEGDDTDAIDTVIYVKNKDTLFGTYRDDDGFYSSFMGHYTSDGSYKYARNVTVYMPKEVSTGHEVDGTSVYATANYYATATDDTVEGSNTYETYYTANGLLSVTFKADEDVADRTIALPSTRDGITAYYDGKIYDNAAADKDKVIVEAVYSDAAEAESALTDFYFYDADEVDAAIRAWIEETDYEYANVIEGKLVEGRTFRYSDYLLYMDNNAITADEVETETLAMIQSVFDDEELFTEAAADVLDNPSISELADDEDYAIQRMYVIYYPADDGSDADYHEDEPVYYTTYFDVKIVKYTDEMYFFDQGLTYATVAEKISTLQEEVEELTALVDTLTAEKDYYKASAEEYEAKYQSALQQLTEYSNAYNEVMDELASFIESSGVSGDDYFGTVTDSETGETTDVAYINGVACTYEDTGETYEDEDGNVYTIYTATGDIDGDRETDTFTFYIAGDGAHVTELNGEEADLAYDETIRALQRKLAAQLTAVRSELDDISSAVSEVAALLGISEDELDGLTNTEQLAVISDYIETLIEAYDSLKADYESLESAYLEIIAAVYGEDTDGEVSAEQIIEQIENSQAAAVTAAIEEALADTEGFETYSESLQEQISSCIDLILDGEDADTSNLSDGLAEMLAEVQAMQAELEELRNASSSYSSLLTTLRAALSLDDTADAAAILASIQNLVSEAESLTAQLKKANATITAIQAKLSTTATGDNLVALVGTATSDSASDSTATAALEEQVASLFAENESLTAENESLTTQVTTLTETVSSLSSGSSDSEAVTALTARVAELTESNTALESENVSLSTEVSKLMDGNADLEAENESLTSESETLAGKYSTLKAKNSTLKTKNSTLKEKNSTLKTKNTTLKTKNDTLKTKISTLTAKIKELTARNTALQSSLVESGSTSASGKTSSKAKSVAESGKASTENEEDASETDEEEAEISGTEIETEKSSWISMTLPDTDGTENPSNVVVNGFSSSDVAADILSDADSVSETTDAVKDHANTILNYFASNLEQLEEAGLPDAIASSTDTVVIDAVVSTDIIADSAQEAAEEDGEDISVQLTSEEFEDGAQYLIVHESEERAGMYDVAVMTAENGTLSFELQDLSPISVAKVSVAETSGFTAAQVEAAQIEAEGVADTSTTDNNSLRKVFVMAGAAAIILLLACAAVFKKKRKFGNQA